MSKCPYCGGNQLVIQITDKLICDGRRWKEGAYARCKKCGMSGPCVPHQTLKGLTRREAIHAFTRPAYLLNKTGLIRLAPDEVVVKRATAEQVVISAELATWLRDMFLDAARRASGSKFANPDYVIGVVWVCGQKCLDVANALTAAIDAANKEGGE